MVLEIVRSFSKGGNTYLLSKDGNSYDFSKVDRWGVMHSISNKFYTDSYIYRNSVYENTSSSVPRLNKLKDVNDSMDFFVKDGRLVIEGQISDGKINGKKLLITGEKIIESDKKPGSLAKKYLIKIKNYLKPLAKMK